MCDKITGTAAHKEWTTAYKVTAVKQGRFDEISREYIGPFSETHFRYGKILRAEYEPEHKVTMDKLLVGFSVLTSIEDARLYKDHTENNLRVTSVIKLCIRRVEIKGMATVGYVRCTAMSNTLNTTDNNTDFSSPIGTNDFLCEPGGPIVSVLLAPSIKFFGRIKDV